MWPHTPQKLNSQGNPTVSKVHDNPPGRKNRTGPVDMQGSHQKCENKFPDFSLTSFSLTSNEISLTILSTTDGRAISYVNISDESRCQKLIIPYDICIVLNAADVTFENYE